MTYSYGADDPYRLLFEPLDGSFKPVQVKWRPKTEEIITDAPAPEYPISLTWSELQNHYYAQKDRWNDYLDWAITGTTRLLDDIDNPTVTEHRETSGTIERDWMEDRNGKRFTFVGGLFVHESALRDGLHSTDLARGDLLYYDVADTFLDGRQHARNVSIHPTTTRQRKPVDAGRIRVGLYVPYIKIWGDGRSLTDPDCPPAFKSSMASLAERMERVMLAGSTPVDVQREIRFLLCCMHRDMPSSVSHDLVAGTSEGTLNQRAYAFALSDLVPGLAVRSVPRHLGPSRPTDAVDLRASDLAHRRLRSGVRRASTDFALTCVALRDSRGERRQAPTQGRCRETHPVLRAPPWPTTHPRLV